MMRLSALGAMLGLLACADPPEAPLRATWSLADQHDTTIGRPALMAAIGCDVALYDDAKARLQLFRGIHHRRVVGLTGSSGALSDIVSLTAAPGGLLVALDWRRRHLIRYRADGTLLSDQVAFTFMPPASPPMPGGFVATDDSTVIYELPGTAATSPIQRVNDAGAQVEQWGVPRANRDAPGRDGALELATWHDSLYAVRRATGTVGVFSLAVPSARPVRTFRLDSLNSGIAVDRRGNVNRTVGPIAIDDAGRLYMIILSGDSAVANSTDRLHVYDRAGHLLDQHSLDITDSRALAVLPDGRIMTFARASHASAAPVTLLAFRALFLISDEHCDEMPKGTVAASSR